VDDCDSCQTRQEHYIANILDFLELGYQQRVTVRIDEIEDGYLGSHKYYYTWDFFLGLEEGGLVIQADGVSGHGTKYTLSDDLFQCARFDYVKNILHIEVETEEEIRELIVKALNRMTDS
jgi:hypothetical protein